MTYLFLATIGPVQSFIASARRTRDLWFGSTLLSELAKTVARVIAQSPGNLLIFPAPGEHSLGANSELNVANKILARIVNEPEELGSLIEIALQNDLKNIYERLFRDPMFAHAPFNHEAARSQIEDLIEYSWVAMKEDDDQNKRDGAYHITRQAVEALLTARKNTRNYKNSKQAIWRSSNPKSSIDGQLESVIEEALYARPRELPQERARKALNLFRQFRAGQAERLSGVDLLKRLGEFSDDQAKRRTDRALFSTSHIAALPYLQRLHLLYQGCQPSEQQSLADAWRSYVTQVRSIHLPAPADKNSVALSPVDEHVPRGKPLHAILQDRDGALLYGERLIEDAVTPDRLKVATQALQAFFSRVNELAHESLAPTPYYAILVADGDGMEKVLDHEAEGGPEQHCAVSRSLDRFGKRVKKLVEGEQGDLGTLVYAGGDDVLAFVPLHRALPCAQQLSRAFREELHVHKNASGDSSTLSVGIAIVHHLSLLSEALEQARSAEKAAKKVTDKDALAIRLCKRSGELYTISGHWGNLDRYLTALIDHYRLNRIPKGLPYELRDSLLRLTALRDAADEKKLIAALKDDAKRILDRKLQVPRRKQLPETGALLRLLAGRIGMVWDEQIEDGQASKGDGDIQLIDGLEDGSSIRLSTFFKVMETYIHEMIIAKELADALNLAEGRPATQQGEALV